MFLILLQILQLLKSYANDTQRAPAGMTEHTQATPRGHPKANDTTDRKNTLGELNAKLHTQKKLNVYEKK